jgi:membrane protein implicated in regulation of membrane protease activity
MSAAGALTAAMISLILLACLAGWLLNVPLWVIAAFAAIGAVLTRGAFRRASGRRARQDTEA